MANKVVDFFAAASSLLARSRLAQFAGITYKGERDLYAALGYKRDILWRDYKDRYERGDISGRIVDMFPQSTWRLPPLVSEGDEPTEFTKAFDKLVKKLKLWHCLERLDRITGIGHYGVLLLGVGNGELDQELVAGTGEESLLYLMPYSEGHATIKTFENNPSSPRFSLPLSYDIEMTGEIQSSAVQKVVHHSRVIHVAEGLTFDNIHGTPRLRRIWNRLDDLDKVLGGTSEATWRVVYGGIQFDIDKDAELKDEDKEALDDELQAYIHNFQRFLRTQGVKATPLGSEVPDPRGAFEVLASIVAGAQGIPQRILFGSERGQLASSQDERNFNARVMERQLSFAEPVILRPTIDKFISLNILPEPEQEYEVEWPDLNRLSQRELSDIAARYGQAIRNVAQQKTNEWIEPSEFREVFLRLPRTPPSKSADTGGNNEDT